MGLETSITTLIESAEIERNNILKKIDDMLNHRFVELLEDSQAIVESYNNIKEMMGLELNLKNTMAEFLYSNSNKLINAANIISKMEIREDNLISEVEETIGNFQELLEKIELAIKEAKINLLKSLENQIKREYQKQSKLNEQSELVEEKVEIEYENEDVKEIDLVDTEDLMIRPNNDKKYLLERLKAKITGVKKTSQKYNNEKNEENIK